MRHLTRALVVSMLVFGGASTTKEARSSTAETPSSEAALQTDFLKTKALSNKAAMNMHSADVLASFPQGGGGHVVQLVEFAPGMTGYVEFGLPIGTTPVVTPGLKKLSLVDLYRHLAGRSATVPKSLLAADARATVMRQTAAAPASKPVPRAKRGNVSGVSSVEEGGAHAYYLWEEDWFMMNYCVGATDCFCDDAGWLDIYSAWEIPQGHGFYFLGSESPVPQADIGMWYWNGYDWIQFWAGVDPRGWQVNIGMVGNGGVWWIDWGFTSLYGTRGCMSAFY